MTDSLLDPADMPSVMVVESNAQMQDIFRSGFKRVGYRVLLTSDPKWALRQFREKPTVADCVIFSAQELGKSALSAFNEFGQLSTTESTPVVLLLDEHQAAWKRNARLAEHRVVVPLPITMKQLRDMLSKLVPSKVG